MFKRCKVVMLPTNKKATSKDICLNRSYGHLTNPLVWGFDDLDGSSNKHLEVQYLYVLSDEEIKENDWIINGNITQDNNCVRRVMSKDQCYGFNQISSIMSHNELTKNVVLTKKIIATTNPFVTGYDDDGHPMDMNGNIVSPLPSPSHSFIEKYASEYNKGNIITDVMVEYVEVVELRNGVRSEIKDTDYKTIVHTKNGGSFNLGKQHGIFDILKINSKDNTITIKKIKDYWSKDEVEQILIDCCNEIYSEDGCLKGKSPAELYKWIGQNL